MLFETVAPLDGTPDTLHLQYSVFFLQWHMTKLINMCNRNTNILQFYSISAKTLIKTNIKINLHFSEIWKKSNFLFALS